MPLTDLVADALAITPEEAEQTIAALTVAGIRLAPTTDEDWLAAAVERSLATPSNGLTYFFRPSSEPGVFEYGKTDGETETILGTGTGDEASEATDLAQARDRRREVLLVALEV